MILAVVALLTLSAAGGRSYAQLRQVDRWEREERRIERRVDGLQRAHDALQLDVKVRLTRIETQIDNGIGMLYALFGVIGIYLAALVGRGAREWINERRAAHKEGA